MVLIASIFSLALHKGWTPTIVVLAVGVSLATFKEFVFDVSSWGEGDSWPDSLMDWAFYMLGAGVATLIFWAALTLSVSHLRS